MIELRVKKIWAVIPEELYSELQKRGKFGNNWDSWISNLISKSLEEEDFND
jgi:hypothetical protein